MMQKEESQFFCNLCLINFFIRIKARVLNIKYLNGKLCMKRQDTNVDC